MFQCRHLELISLENCRPLNNIERVDNICKNITSHAFCALQTLSLDQVLLTPELLDAMRQLSRLHTLRIVGGGDTPMWLAPGTESVSHEGATVESVYVAEPTVPRMDYSLVQLVCNSPCITELDLSPRSVHRWLTLAAIYAAATAPNLLVLGVRESAWGVLYLRYYTADYLGNALTESNGFLHSMREHHLQSTRRLHTLRYTCCMGSKSLLRGSPVLSELQHFDYLADNCFRVLSTNGARTILEFSRPTSLSIKAWLLKLSDVSGKINRGLEQLLVRNFSGDYLSALQTQLGTLQRLRTLSIETNARYNYLHYGNIRQILQHVPETLERLSIISSSEQNKSTRVLWNSRIRETARPTMPNVVARVGGIARALPERGACAICQDRYTAHVRGIGVGEMVTAINAFIAASPTRSLRIDLFSIATDQVSEADAIFNGLSDEAHLRAQITLRYMPHIAKKCPWFAPV
jgi:hypothetical protein